MVITWRFVILVLEGLLLSHSFQIRTRTIRSAFELYAVTSEPRAVPAHNNEEVSSCRMVGVVDEDQQQPDLMKTTAVTSEPMLLPADEEPYFANEVSSVIVAGVDEGQQGPAAITKKTAFSASISRREWLSRGAVLMGGLVIGVDTVNKTLSSRIIEKPHLGSINLTAVAKETAINVTMESSSSFVSLDSTTFQKKRNVKLPPWYPTVLVPPPKVVKDIPNSELLVASIIAGSSVEMARASLLYPLLTLKARIQNDANKRRNTRTKNFQLKRRLKILQLNAKRHFQEGRLYAGIVPTLTASVPATGIYYGSRDVTKRMLATVLPPTTPLSTVEIAVIAAFVADVLSLMVRIPADALAIRLQVATGEVSHQNKSAIIEESDSESDTVVEAKVGNWFAESIERLPAVILTDLPYLLTRIAINKSLMQGEVDIGRYELTAITTAVFCAFFTTPFDVARTRILVDRNSDPTNGIDGGSGQGLLRTMLTIREEGDGGIANLFAGWLERTLYLGIGRAWLEPFQLVGYTAIRDAILLQAFD